MRTKQDYLDADPNRGFHGHSLITKLSVFNGPQMYVLDEMHLLARGIGSELYQMLTVSLSSANTRFYYTLPNGDYNVENYPFYIPNQRLNEIGEAIERTRQYIPVGFDGSFQNIIKNTRGTRAVDYLDFALVNWKLNYHMERYE